MDTTRRTLLKASLASAGLLTLGGAALALRGTVQRPPPAGLLVLSPTQYSVLAAIADTFYPGGDGLPSGSVAGVPERIDAVMGRKHPADAAEFLQVLGLVENALVALFVDQRAQTFTGSSHTARVAALDGWRTSRLSLRRTGFKALHGLCAGAYWSLPTVYPVAGYSGPPDYGQAGAAKPTTFEPLPNPAELEPNDEAANSVSPPTEAPATENSP